MDYFQNFSLKKQNQMSRLMYKDIRFFLLVLLVLVISCKPPENSTIITGEPLILKEDTTTSSFSYYDSQGKKVLGTYKMAFTDTLIDFAIVADPGFTLINRKGEHLYDIFTYDNGPDYPTDGLFRIIKNGKIGYVDAKTANLIIEPIYTCAYPFENGKAKVSTQCTTSKDGEHVEWKSENWFYIDKKGNKIK